MKYLLDTNACVTYLNKPDSFVKQRLIGTPRWQICVCSVVKAELFYGAMKSQNPAQTLLKQQEFLNQFVSLAFDDPAAGIFGVIRADLTQKGTPIGPYDLQIAAIAMAYRLTLVTHNTREFSRISGLNLEDWEI